MTTVAISLKHRVWNLVETAEGDDLASRLVDVFIVSLIVLSTVLTVLDSIPGLFDSFNRWLFAFDYFVIAVFTVEYLVRLWACTADPRYAHPVRGRLRYATTPLALVDLIAILPSYTPWFLPRGLLFLRTVRLIRLLRLFKVGRYSDTPLLVLNALRRRKAELLSALFALSLMLLSAAGLLYLAENPHQPHVYSSIPQAMWWALLSVTGNGQAAPVTTLGRLVSSAMAVIGVGLFAVPAGLLASAFTQELSSDRPNAGVGDENIERMTERVVLAHIAKWSTGWDQASFASDYDPQALVITGSGILRGPAGGSAAAREMHEMGGTGWRLISHSIAGGAALLRWETSPGTEPVTAIETIIVQGGLIRFQTLELIPGRARLAPPIE